MEYTGVILFNMASLYCASAPCQAVIFGAAVQTPVQHTEKTHGLRVGRNDGSLDAGVFAANTMPLNGNTNALVTSRMQESATIGRMLSEQSTQSLMTKS